MRKPKAANDLDNPGGLKVAGGPSLRHGEDMTKTCCTTMHAMSLTAEEIIAELGPKADVDDWRPIVQWREDLGLNVIDETPIYFCPWCGSRLAKDRNEPLGALRKSGVLFEVNPDGTVHATIDGAPL